MTAKEFLRAALSPRILVMLVVLGLAAALCVRLGIWQFDRAAVRGAQEFETAHAERLVADPVPLHEALAPGQEFRNDLVGAHVTATGTYEDGARAIVIARRVAGEPAATIVEGLRLTEGPDGGALIPVARGWVPATDPETLAGVLDDPALAPPAGEVTVAGHLAGSEPAEAAAELPEGIVRSLSPAQLTGQWGGPGYSAYVVAEEPDDAGGVLGVMDRPGLAEDTGLNLRNLLYAAEWVIFAGFALALWIRMVRDQVLAEREEELLLGAFDPQAAR